ncbi:MAG: hypothetical protein VKP72_01060 [bacterium]|nr:hypothetical protein [bacterium]
MHFPPDASRNTGYLKPPGTGYLKPIAQPAVERADTPPASTGSQLAKEAISRPVLSSNLSLADLVKGIIKPNSRTAVMKQLIGSTRSRQSSTAAGPVLAPTSPAAKVASAPPPSKPTAKAGPAPAPAKPAAKVGSAPPIPEQKSAAGKPELDRPVIVSPDERRRAVDDFLKGKASLDQIAQRSGVSASTIRDWATAQQHEQAVASFAPIHESLKASSNPDIRKLAAAIAPSDTGALGVLQMFLPIAGASWSQNGQLSNAAKAKMASLLAGALDLKPLPHTGLKSGADLVSAILKNCNANNNFSYQGSDTSSCVASVLERQLVLNHADTYARLAIDLLTTGKSTLPDGAVLKSEPVDFTVQEGRTVVSDAIQEAMLRAGEAMDAADADRFGGLGRKASRPVFGGTRSLAARKSYAGNEGGMSAEAAEQLQSKLTGKPQIRISDPEEMRKILTKVGSGAGSDKSFVTLLKPMDWSEGVGHAVHLKNWDARHASGSFNFDDPSGVDSRISKSGTFNLNLDQLVSSAACLIVPADWAVPPAKPR